MVSPRKSRRKSACFSRTTTETPARARSNPSIMPAGPPPATTHCTCMVAVYRLLNLDELSARDTAGVQCRVNVEVEVRRVRDDRVRLVCGHGQVRRRKAAGAIGQHILPGRDAAGDQDAGIDPGRRVGTVNMG